MHASYFQVSALPYLTYQLGPQTRFPCENKMAAIILEIPFGCPIEGKKSFSPVSLSRLLLKIHLSTLDYTSTCKLNQVLERGMVL
jgi:hypothetical protein